jgi:hypothetical protein
VDAGGGWLIFALPPAELAAHPAEEGGRHELYLMCNDVHATVAELKAKGVDFAGAISDEGFGPVTAIRLPRLFERGHAGRAPGLVQSDAARPGREQHPVFDLIWIPDGRWRDCRGSLATGLSGLGAVSERITARDSALFVERRASERRAASRRGSQARDGEEPSEDLEQQEKNRGFPGPADPTDVSPVVSHVGLDAKGQSTVHRRHRHVRVAVDELTE